MEALKEPDLMLLTKYIPKSCILPQMLVAKKSEVIKELTHLLFEKKKLKGVDAALDQIVAREVTESTGLGRGLAVPHARIPGIKTLTCAVGRVPGGIDFAAVDRKPVYLVFLVFYPPTQQTTYLNFIATLVRLIKDPKNMKEVMAAETVDEIFETLQGASECFVANHEEKIRRIAADPGIENVPDAHADLILLARLQLYEEMLSGTRTGKTELRQRIENIRPLVEPRILKHYDRLMKSRPPALVSVEGDTCQGCFMKLPTKFAQAVRQDTNHIHTCNNCSRFIYVV